MKYVDWVDVVLRAAVEALGSATGFMTHVWLVAERLPADVGPRSEPLWDALRDLERFRVVPSTPSTPQARTSDVDNANGRQSARPKNRSSGRWRTVSSR